MNRRDQFSFSSLYSEHARRARERERKKNGSMLARSLVDNIRKKTGYIEHTHTYTEKFSSTLECYSYTHKRSE
jgi:hypothetical protein